MGYPTTTKETALAPPPENIRRLQRSLYMSSNLPVSEGELGNTVRWLSYEFGVYSDEGSWSNVGGIYIFAGLNSRGAWVPYYIGQCEDFHNRIPSHEQWDIARSQGATHVHARTVPKAADRERIEAGLISYFQPRLNTQGR